jgi:hypothetical protein
MKYAVDRKSEWSWAYAISSLPAGKLENQNHKSGTKKSERPVGGPAARGHGVMEVQTFEVAFGLAPNP